MIYLFLILISLFFDYLFQNKFIITASSTIRKTLFTDMWKFSTGSEEINYEKYELLEAFSASFN
jgi:hypothetical protein